MSSPPLAFQRVVSSRARFVSSFVGGRARGGSGTGRPNAAAQPKPARAKQPSSAGKQPAFVFGAYQPDSACGKGPLPCASGLVSEPDKVKHQTTVRCGGLCPAGHVCSAAATVAP